MSKNKLKGSQRYDFDPIQVFSASRAHIDSEHFGHILFLTEDFEVLVLTKQDVEPLPRFPPDTLFAVRWQSKSTSNPAFLGRTITPTRAAIADYMMGLPTNEKWQEVLGHSVPTEDNAKTRPSSDPRTSEIADPHNLNDARGHSNGLNKLILSAARHQQAQESSPAGENPTSSPAEAAETPLPSLVTPTEVKNDLVNNIFPLMYHVVFKVILLICFLTLCGYLLDWAWSIKLSYLQTKFTSEGDPKEHTTFNKTQAEISFVYHALFAVLTAFYFMMW